MKITAIVCEYNPMTNGHLKHLELARTETGADTILCVMSGSFTQRGDSCIADKYMRASVACRLGADIVVELPTIYAISPADNFAYGAVKTIMAFPNVEYISFGSECGEIDPLLTLAKLLANEPVELQELIQANLRRGDSHPRARAGAVEAFIADKEEYKSCVGVLNQPNNVLGIAYICAIIKLGSTIKPHTIKRVGGGYNEEESDIPYPSATAVRKAIVRGELETIKKAVPPFTYNLLESYKKNGTSLSDLIMFKIKSISGYDLEKYYDISGGLHNRIKMASSSVNSLDELLEAVKCKNLTMARLKRIALYTLFDITQEMYDRATECPPYVFILALNKNRKDILSELSEYCPNVLVRYSDVNKVDKSLRFLIKLDFTAQGTLEIINRNNVYIKKMMLV